MTHWLLQNPDLARERSNYKSPPASIGDFHAFHTYVRYT